MAVPCVIAPLVAFVTAGALLAPSSASADPAAAEELFREGRRLLDEGKTDEACLKLAESQVQDPSSGTLLNLGLCHEKQHKIATAWSDYISAARLAREQGRLDRAVVAEHKSAELEPRLPRLMITVTTPPPGLQISRGDERLGPGLLGSAIPVDPGHYLVTASAPGRKGWKTTVDLGEAESKVVQVPELEPDLEAAAEAGAPSPSGAPEEGAAGASASSAPGAPPATGPDARAGRKKRSPPASGWIVGGAGVAALGVGAAFGLASLASYHDANTLCPSHEDCFPNALSARSSAQWKAWVSDVALGVGIAGVGTGGWILLFGRRSAPPARTAVRATVDGTGLGLSVEQRF